MEASVLTWHCTTKWINMTDWSQYDFSKLHKPFTIATKLAKGSRTMYSQTVLSRQSVTLTNNETIHFEYFNCTV